MGWDAIGAIGEIVGALAVVLTLFYLASQVKQGSRQEQIHSFAAERDLFLQTFDRCTGTPADAEIFRQGLNHFRDLKPGDQGVFHSQMHGLTHGFHGLWVQFKAGILPKEELVACRNLYIQLLMTPGGEQWWASFRQAMPPHFVEYLETEIQQAQGNLPPAHEAYPWLQDD